MRREDGQATTEAVLVIPLLLLIVLAMVTFTQIIHARTIVMLASNQAARLGAVVYGNPHITPEDARQQAYAAAEGVVTRNLSGSDYTIIVTDDGTNAVVTTTFRMNSPVPWWRVITGSSTMSMEHTATYRIEKQ